MLSFLFRDIKLLSMMISLSKHRNNRISIGFLFFIKMKTKSAAFLYFRPIKNPLCPPRAHIAPSFTPPQLRGRSWLLRADTRDTRRFTPSRPLRGFRNPVPHPFPTELHPPTGKPCQSKSRGALPSPPPLYIVHSTLYMFTFSAKERDPETGLSYFGSRYYSSDLSIWLSVDPMAAKYASLSPYVYCADNPVRCVDPNGEEIEIVTTIDENGNKIITINFTAKIVNKSSHPFSKRKMEKMRDEISTGIQTYYSGQYDDATVDVNVDIICNNEEQSDDLWKEENRHSIFIVDKCSNPRWIAEAEEGGSYMNIRWNIERGANDNNLKRTAAHEFGHLLGLPDVKIEGNLMRSGGNGVNVTWGQIQEVVTNYSQHRINNGILKHYFENYRHNHH